jgi:hypothetical protein
MGTISLQVIEQWLYVLSYGRQEYNNGGFMCCHWAQLTYQIQLLDQQSEALVKHSLLQQHLAG